MTASSARQSSRTLIEQDKRSAKDPTRSLQARWSTNQVFKQNKKKNLIFYD